MIIFKNKRFIVHCVIAVDYIHIGIGSISIFGGPNLLYTAITAICAAYMNINKVSKVKYRGGDLAPRPLVPTPMIQNNVT